MQEEKVMIHRLLSGTKCSNREDCPCGPQRVEEGARVYWVHKPVIELFGPVVKSLNELQAVKQ